MMRVVAIVLLLVSASGAYQTPPAGDKNKHANHAKAHNAKAHYESQDGERSQTVVMQEAINSDPTKQPSNGITPNGSDHPHDWIDWLNAFSTAVIAAFTILLFVGVMWQIGTSRAIERAWLVVEIGKLPDFESDPMTLQYLYVAPIIHNHGKTTARIKRFVARVQIVPEGESLPTKPEYAVGQTADHKVDTVLPPTAPIQPVRLPITSQELTDAQQGIHTIYVHGFVDYRDLGGTLRHSGFCYLYSVQLGFSPFPTGFYFDLTAPLAYTECT